MPHNETLVNGMHRAFNKSLLGGVSLLALMIVSDLGEARSLTPSNSVVPTATAQQAAIAAAQQAAGAASQAQASLARAAAALRAAAKLQQDAAAAARAATSSVPNGLVTGGLMPAGGTDGDPLAGFKPDPNTGIKPNNGKWIGADQPNQTSNGAQVQVDINQTQQKGIFYWDTFNVGASTTVNFKQAQSDWIALNRVLDPSAAPSRILGQINAPGAVYLINRNGIIFGAGSQINVETLVASSLDIGQLGSDLTARDQFFLNTGIANLNSFSIYDADQDAGARGKLVAGDITVERGASITANTATDLVKLGSPGAVYLFGANVTNSGSISAPAGEIGMVAARTIDLVPNGYSVLPDAVLGKDSSGKLLDFRGTEFVTSPFALSYDSSGHARVNQYLSGTGTVTHDGMIQAAGGSVVMNGDRILVDNPRDANGGALKDAFGNLVQGVISVDTSIDRNSMVLLRSATSVTMNGVISSLPFDDGAAPLTGGSGGSAAQSFTPPYIEMSAQSSVTVGSSGLISAPSAQVALRAINLGSVPGIYKQTGTSTIGEPIFGQRLFNQGGSEDVISSTPQVPQTVLLAPGATIDLAGLQNVQLPASYNFISFQPRAEFADMPLQRLGPLYGQTLWIDIRASGTRSDGSKWVGTPLADASGYVNNVGSSIYQLMTVGGSVSLKTGLTTDNGGAGVQTAGSVVNLAGGGVEFLPGMVNTTRLLGADGRIYGMANADPNMTYLGIAGQFSVNHSRWGVTETWSTATQTYSPGYTEGHDAGSISVTTVSPSLAGTMYFGSTAGERQIVAGQLPLQGSLALTTPSSVQIGKVPSANYAAQSASTTTMSADTLSGYGLSALTVTANDLVVSSGSTLKLAPGGNFSVTAGGAIDIAGTVSAAGGAINLVTDRLKVNGDFGSQLFKEPVDQSRAAIAANVFVSGTLDVSGRFINDTGRIGTDASGPAFTDGGTISITTNKSSATRDTTGSILLADSSVLDVSSGGYMSLQGKPKSASVGVMAGKAGSISLAIYQGKKWVLPGTGIPERPEPSVSKVAVLELDGRLLGYGFEKNGSLRLAGADTIRIGGILQAGETSAIRIGGAPSTLPASLLTSGGLGAYTIESAADDWSGAPANIIVTAGTSLTLQQQNLSSLVDYRSTPTGTKLGQQGTPALALLPDDQRKPVDLTLKGDNILLDAGAKIATDPKAKITLGAINPDHTLLLSDPTRNVPAQNVDLLGSIVDHGGTVFINALNTHLGSQALVDLSGEFVANSRFSTTGGPAISGTVLAGGSFTVEAGTIAADPRQTYYVYSAPPAGGNYLVADSGSQLDVSGSAGTVQVTGAHGAASPVWSWSDAGTVSADVSGFAWGGSFAATGGRFTGSDGKAHSDPRANGGTIILGGGAISLRQDTRDVDAALSNFRLGSVPRSLSVAADQLASFDNVYLYAASAPAGAGRIFTDLPGNIYGLATPSFGILTISGALDWRATNRLQIAAGAISSATPVDARLSASYVLLTGGGSPTVAGGSSLTVNGQAIDIEGAAFSGFGQVSLISSGDLRLSTPKVANGILTSSASQLPTELSTFTGTLDTKADLLLSAQRVYPASAVDFTIKTPGNVSFAAPEGSSARIPLAAGGSVTVFAKTIHQGGNLFAPLGKITLGNTDSTVSAITTQSVVLDPGSLTSVTLADTIVPYGATADGTNWYYNANLNPLSQPPAKALVLAGANVTRSDGSTIDLRGGGELQAMEWIQGKGGSRDTLTTTPAGQTVYALVPSQNDPVSAYDIHFAAARSADAGKTVVAGDAYPLAGTQITVNGGAGIAAGSYTLYPAHYATLPGAMRVVDYGDNSGRNLPTGASLPDGTVLVTGGYTQSTSAAKQSVQHLFAVQTNSVWQQYSEYSFNLANGYFSQLAAKQNLIIPRLPMDAGRLTASALQSIVLNGVALTQPGRDSSGNTGRGGELDISAPQLAVVGHAQYARNDIPAGYVGIDVAQLNGFESVLIGGRRSDIPAGTLVTPGASSVVVDTRGETFSAPEILLVAQQVGQWQEVKQWVSVGSGANSSVLVDFPVYQPLAGSGSVTIKAGSIIETKGVVHAGLGRSYIVVSDAQAPVTAASLAAALGGTLSGTEILNVDLANLPASWFTNGFQSSAHVVSNSASQLALAYYANGGPQQPGRGALFAVSNDPSLQLRGPAATGASAPAITVTFADVTSADASRVSTAPDAPVPTGQVTGSLIVPGGDTSNSGQVSIAAGARISTDTLTVQATAATKAITIDGADLHASQVNLAAPSIGIGAGTPVADKSLLLAANSAQFADVQALTLRALSGPVTVYGDFNPGPRSLTLDSSGIVLGAEVVNPGASLNLRAGEPVVFSQAATVQFSVGATVTSAAGVVTSYAANAPIALDANSKVSLAAAGTLTVSGTGAATLTRDSLLSASDNIALKNTGTLSFAGGTPANGNTLQLIAREIDLASGPVNGNPVNGSLTIAGFSTVNWFAGDSVVVKGPGAMALGLSGDRVDLTVTTPRILVAGASAANSQSFALTTSGNISVVDSVARNAAAGRPADSAEIGGSLEITASNVTIASTIQAQAGTITLDAIAGNVTLNAGAYIAARGYKKTLVDVDTYGAGGKVVLYADIGGQNPTGGGKVITDPNSIVDVATPLGGYGYGGTIEVSAPRGGATLAGRLLGGGGPGLGGRFKLDINDAADLTALADNLLSGGVTGAIDIHTRSGNLELAPGHTLKANAITLTADDPTWITSQRQFGQVIVGGTLDATGYAGKTADGSGQAGGRVGLFGHNAVVLTGSGQILARTAHNDERGGDVMIGTAWSAAGNIDLQSGSNIDVSGGIKGGLSGGTVTLRAPLDGNNDVKIKNLDSTITGARAVNIQGFLTLNTEASANNQNGVDGSRLTTGNGTPVVWDGYIDPAGLLTSKGTVPDFGSWTNVTGERLNVTPGSGYSTPPNISVLPGIQGAGVIAGTTVIDPNTGATFYEVTDPVTGTTFRSSLQVASVTITNGGSYTSAPTMTVTAANGANLPNWGVAATAKAKMAFNDIDVSGLANLPDFPNIGDYAGRNVNLLGTPPGGQLQVIGTGHLVITNGTPMVVVDTSTITSTVPTQLFVRTSFFGGILYPAGGFSTTMRVTGATLTGGAGYSGGVNVAFSSGSATATATMGAAVTITGVSKGYASGADLPTVQIAGTGAGASVSFAAQTAGLTGATDQNYLFAPSVTSNFIPLASSAVFKGAGDAAALTVTPYQAHTLFYGDVLANFVEGHGIQGGPDLAGKSYGFGGLIDRLQNGLVKRLGADVVHVQPGIELVNTKVSDTTNSGNITVVSNWNLAAGSAGNLQAGSGNGQSFQYFDPASSYVDFNYRLATPWGGFDAGALTLRAAGNINVNASISDGFFQFGNYLDPNYIAWVQSYVVPVNAGNNSRTIDPGALAAYTYYLNDYSGSAVPIAPYQPVGNAVSPTAQDLATTDLFPHQLRVCTADCSPSNIKMVTAPSSWSYAFAAGADVSSANPAARVSLASTQSGIGDVTIDRHSTYRQPLIVDTASLGLDVTVNLPTMVRTGTGSIDIAAARDVVLNDIVAPGVIYAAGVNTAKLIDPNYILNTANGVSRVAVGNSDESVKQDLFLEPRVLAYGNSATSIANGSGLYYGPPAAAAFPEQGGDVNIDAQRDIVGYNGSGNKVLQYYQPWLLSDSGVTPAASALAGSSAKLFGAGVFTPSGTQIASQTAWWIQYSSFQQDILSAGGNVSVIAGRDLKDVSVSLPTTGRVSGGLSATSTPVTHIYDSGNMAVVAGRDILGGSFYEGSGHASITAGRSVGQNATVSRYASNKLRVADYPLLAVDTGQIEMVARGSIATAGVVNPAELHVQQPSFANPLDLGGNSAKNPLYMDTYGPDSKVRLVAQTGDLTIAISPTAITDLSATGVNAAAAIYPASFEALALNGSLITTGISTKDATGASIPVPGALIPMPGIVLSPSQHGTFELLAQSSIDLSFGYPKNSTTLLGTPRPYVSAGPALIDTAFDPFQPNSGFDGAFSGTALAHKDDATAGVDAVARMYAATGDITATGSYGQRTTSDDHPGYQHIEINRPTKIYAGRDIVDLNIVVQNTHASDVSSIIAGRNIFYTGYNNAGGLQVAGPGFFAVQAGGDIGPFLPAAHDNSSEAAVQEGIASVGNSSPTAVGNIYVSSVGGSVGMYDQALLGSFANPRRNALLTAAAGSSQGADIITLFGTKFGVDYSAVINAYLDPANAAKVAYNYIAELKDFLGRVGKPAGASDATALDAFKALPADLQHVFIDQVFFAELKAVGIARKNGATFDEVGGRAYQAINTMFPSSLGYTANSLDHKIKPVELVSTGNLDMRHATVQTQLGGNISMFGPGGNIIVGSLAVEPNPRLKLRDLGVLTLGGGEINSFTDQSVLVNSSRVLTTQGGDILMFSSNIDLNAGRGSKTISSTPALQVQFDQNDYPSVDLGGFVTGSGIATLQASTFASSSSVYLMAPRGEIDLGTAGVRSSGDLVVVAPVISNAGNVTVQGSTTGTPVISVPNVGALTSGSNSAGAAAKPDTPTAAGGNGERASVFIVEVVGYGGDGQGSSGSQDSSADEQSGSESSEKRRR